MPGDLAKEGQGARLLRELWTAAGGPRPTTFRACPAVARAIDAGADPADLAAALTYAAYEAMVGKRCLLDFNSETEVVEDGGPVSECPGTWRVCPMSC